MPGPNNVKRILVVGAGSWGITIALLLRDNGHEVMLYEALPALYQRLARDREEKDKLPGYRIPDSILITNDLAAALKGTNIVVFAVPSQYLRSVIRGLKGHDFSGSIVVNVAKGIESPALKRMSEVLSEENKSIGPANYVILSGPSHAEEVVRKMPTAIVAASSNPHAAEVIQEIFSTPYLRVYTNDDVAGVELAGSLKNIIAIAAGILDGLGFGDNIKGALLTRGMVEITRLGIALGAKKETFFGLTGIGDLITTCISRHSRNRHVGEKLGKGEGIKKILGDMKMVAEGVETTRSAYQLAKKAGTEMPITEKMYKVLFEGESPSKAVKELMEREPKPEVI